MWYAYQLTAWSVENSANENLETYNPGKVFNCIEESSARTF